MKLSQTNFQKEKLNQLNLYTKYSIYSENIFHGNINVSNMTSDFNSVWNHYRTLYKLSHFECNSSMCYPSGILGQFKHK